ncbi:hypothetical protein SD70_01540 [Gordoniibacillus kamchatkensis]|uniref:Uncharacterized protein n=1 Tax=Gordoniibacillus kamchatkensis TaxID=1590651 RepID=A0ABR5AMM2_9BACL|nr:hypothetical protein [Paenibacillus sp. VKM B-2647]KIL42249.1 hypothetical protein SD70_01540 [Paenibacillus sp. VKM B-2647]
MKKDKWLKWKIGAVASLGLGLLFQEVRSSDAFAAKIQAETSGDGAKSSAATDGNSGDLFAYEGNSGQTADPGTGRRKGHHRTGAAFGSEGGNPFGGSSGANPGSGSNSGSDSGSYTGPSSPGSSSTPSAKTHTRTGRS